MSAPVDVLAVMEEAAHALNSVDYRIEREELLEAHAAVAELIEAANKVADRCWTHMGNESLYEMMALRDILARVGGAS